jgi:succinylarginine dihydrolase
VRAVQLNLDGLPGPSHNYAGLAPGNIASQVSAATVSNPRAAALQGLAKMRALWALGVPQGLLPPHDRPALGVLRRIGFGGRDQQVLARASREAPQLFAACCSASAMWAANAATVSPSADSADGRVHFTPANLAGNLHRAIETPFTARVLQRIFADPARFAHHQPLPALEALGDEGAANHTRLCPAYGEPGVELFVYGRDDAVAPAPQRFPARQSREASAAVARLHGLAPGRTLLRQQLPEAIDAGVFHNDVIAVGDRDLLFLHQRAFLDQGAALTRLREACSFGLHVVELSEAAVSLAEAVSTYLFNSQLLALADGTTALLVPVECAETPRVWAALQALLAGDNPISRVEVVNLRQSMRNGGGPACLRLRVELSETELAAVAPGVLCDGRHLERLEDWVRRHYRDRLAPAELADPALLQESRVALDELTTILGLPALYDFQNEA